MRGGALGGGVGGERGGWIRGVMTDYDVSYTCSMVHLNADEDNLLPPISGIPLEIAHDVSHRRLVTRPLLLWERLPPARKLLELKVATGERPVEHLRG